MTLGIEPPAVPDSISFRHLNAEEFIELGDNAALRLSESFLHDAKRRGDDMFAAFDDTRLVSYVWRARDWAPHVAGLRVRVNAPYCYSYNSYTVPEFRGQRISPATHLYSDRTMVKEGYTHRIGFVAIDNYRSLAMGKYMGSCLVGYAGYCHWFGRYLPFRTIGVRQTGFEFFVPTAG